MVFSLIGVREEELAFRKHEDLRAELGFVDMNEMKRFVKSDRFRPYFETYAYAWILPQQKAVKHVGTSRGRGPQFITVEERMLVGERSGSDKFSTPYPDKSNWDQMDHCAYAMYGICRANTKSASGLFFNKGLSPAQINLRVWLLIKYEEYNWAPSRRLPPGGTRDPSAESEPERSASNTPQPPTPNLPDRSVGARSGSVPPQPPTTPPRLTPPPPPSPEDERLARIRLATNFPSSAAHNQEIIQPDKWVEVVQSNNQKLEFDRDVDEENKDSIETEILTNAQIMAIENGARKFDIKERFWKAWLIDELIRKGNDVRALKESLELAGQITTRIADHDQKAWFDKVTRDQGIDTIQYQPWDDAAAAEFDAQQSYFDSEDYQREDLEDSCRLLHIPWYGDKTIFRMPGMNLSQQLKFWQPVAVKAIIEFCLQPHLRACFLADYTGLGKTWIIVSYLLWLQKFREDIPAKDRPLAKPILILMPKALISQWIKAIDLIAPNAFEVYKYHGDTRRSKPIANERTVMGTLHHAHELFDGKEQRSRAIIISSYTTFAVRHGPAAIRKHRINKLAMSKTEADKIRFEADALWEGSLENCFDLVVNDECHLLKSLSADVSNSVLWLNALRYIMISATLIPNGISDWLGYMPFAEPFDADEWWSERSLAEMRFRDDEDPFSVPDEHVAAKLQLTVRAVKDWILTHRIDPAEQGFRMAKMWKKLVIRRTPQSRIPFGTGRKIADSLPRVKAAIINCSFNEEERGWYIESEKKLTGQLLVPGEGTKPAKWSLAVQRKLLLLTTWISLPNLDEIQNLKSTNMKRTFDEERFFLEWFTAHTKPSMENPGPLLQELLEGAPKLRALLRNVRSQVVRDQEKILIFCQLPAVTVLLVAIFRLLAIDCVTLGAYQQAEERDAVITAFTECTDRAQILITTYAVGSTGLNLQQMCWRVHMVECAHNLGVQAQALGRAVRVGNPSAVVWMYEYYVAGSFDSRMIWRNIEKAIPQAMAELNRQIFNGGDDAGDVTVDLGEWVFKEGEMVRYDRIEWNEWDRPHILSPHEVLQYILLQRKGEEILL